MARRVLLDVDTGIDDALALLLALRSRELELVAATTVAGNVPVDVATRNTLAVLALAGRSDVPVAAGAARPLGRRLTTATFFHGRNGLGDIELPDSPAGPVATPAPALLAEAARSQPHDLTIVAVGPLTNLALAIRLDPQLPRLVHELIVMGGAAFVPGNVTAAAEANFHNDPEAAALVFGAFGPSRLTMVGLDVTERASLRADRFAKIQVRRRETADPVTAFACDALDYYMRADLAAGLEGSPLHDPLAVAAAARPDLLTRQGLRVEIETQGRLTRGASVANRRGRVQAIESRGGYEDVVGLRPVAPNVQVCLDVDANAFVSLFCQRLGLEPADG